MTYQAKYQRVNAGDLLKALAAGEEVRLDRCTISGAVDLNLWFAPQSGYDLSALTVSDDGTRKHVTLHKPVVMYECTFEDDVFFAPPWDRPGELSVRFEKEVVFNSSRFRGQTRVSGAVFEDLASFDGCTFERVCCFRHSSFLGRARFRTASFQGYALFNGVSFENEAYFTNASFGKGLNMHGAAFAGRTDFAGVHSLSKSVPVIDEVRFARRGFGDDETFWRFIKQAAQEAGVYQLAGECFYRERCANFRRRLHGGDKAAAAVTALTAVRLLPEFIFGWLLFGYGERPVRILLAALLIIAASGVFYASPLAHITSDLGPIENMTLTDGLYLSTMTFMTVGYGDLYPNAASLPTRAVTIAEALCGPCMVALFVVSVAKRFSRG